jgi:hypothetical protein
VREKHYCWLAEAASRTRHYTGRIHMSDVDVLLATLVEFTFQWFSPHLPSLNHVVLIRSIRTCLEKLQFCLVVSSWPICDLICVDLSAD